MLAITSRQKMVKNCSFFFSPSYHIMLWRKLSIFFPVSISACYSESFCKKLSILCMLHAALCRCACTWHKETLEWVEKQVLFRDPVPLCKSNYKKKKKRNLESVMEKEKTKTVFILQQINKLHSTCFPTASLQLAWFV